MALFSRYFYSPPLPEFCANSTTYGNFFLWFSLIVQRVLSTGGVKSNSYLRCLRLYLAGHCWPRHLWQQGSIPSQLNALKTYPQFTLGTLSFRYHYWLTASAKFPGNYLVTSPFAPRTTAENYVIICSSRFGIKNHLRRLFTSPRINCDVFAIADKQTVLRYQHYFGVLILIKTLTSI